MKIVHIVGARPNFMKAEPVLSALSNIQGIEQVLVHTGQHYDVSMSAIFFKQLGLREPDINLEVGSSSHAVQIATIMVRLERFLLKSSPTLVLVYGDVNSTVAAALVCAKIGIPVGHIEAGLRSFDRTMPEEVNRVITDQVANMLFTHSVTAKDNLISEGISPERIHFVGNVMIDTVLRLLPQAESIWPKLSRDLNLYNDPFGIVTLHRPSNVDDPRLLKRIFIGLSELSKKLPLVFPVHPRTRVKLKTLHIKYSSDNLHLIEPFGYLEFLALQKNAALVITDSGGIQEETSFLNVPCLTMRYTTERPVTVQLGTNYLIGQNMTKIEEVFYLVLAGNAKRGITPPLWDGRASLRITSAIAGIFSLRLKSTRMNNSTLPERVGSVGGSHGSNHYRK